VTAIERRIARNRERVPARVLAVLEMEPTPPEYVLNPDGKRTFYTASIQKGEIGNARLIGLMHKKGQQAEGYWVWVGEHDTASEIGDEWFQILWNFNMSTDHASAWTWDEIFTTRDNEIIYWTTPFTMQNGDYIVHDEQ
jgi:hypothetical protein